MDYREVQELINEPRPAPEEHVDIECAHCVGQWASDPGTKCFAPGEGIHAVTFRNYVGDDNVAVSASGKVLYYCPNGCHHLGSPKKLHNIVEAGNPTPTDRWEYAQLIYRKQQLSSELDSVETLLGNYEGMYF